MEPELIIPVYLNQKIVFDLLAIYEDGFSQMRSVQKQNTNNDNTSASISGEIGSSNIFSFLGVKLKADAKTVSSEATDQTVSEERIHTPSSLFAKLLSYLKENDKINVLENYTNLESLDTGDFVQFKGAFTVNPLIKMFDSFSQLMKLAFVMGGTDETTPTTQNKKKGAGQKKDPNQVIVEQIEALTSSLKLGGMIDLMCQIDKSSNLTAVIQAENDFFNNKNIAQIEAGEYNLLGKVVKIASGADDPISLLRNTSLSLTKQNFLTQMLEAFQSPTDMNDMFEFPEIKSEVYNGILVLPIAIFS